jgi:OmpA-OmpF porin, OOP family
MKRATALAQAGAPNKIALAILAMLVAPVAIAQDLGWYGGINFGQSRAKIDDARIISGLAAGRLATTSISDDDKDTGYKIFGGYQFNRTFSLEGGFFDLGEFGFSARTLPLGTFDGRIKVRGLNLDLVGTLPVTDRFSAFARVGANHAEARDTFTSTGLVRVLNANPSKRDTNIKYGVGLQYAINDRLGIRAEVERYRIDDAVGNKGDIDLASIGLTYRFGRPVPAPIRAMAPEPVMPIARATLPDPVAVAPPIAPVVAPPATPPQPMRVSFSADALFDFDKSTLKPEGKRSLDKFAADLRGTRFDVIKVTGHTDRLGSASYNMTLSTKRAEAVSNYLVDPAAIPVSRISATGVGESAPTTRPDDCKGAQATKTLIACLQPDRRVDVEVTGTK